MTTCVVTGAAGFLGYFLAKLLSEQKGYEVICVDNFVRGEHDPAYASLLQKSNVRGFSVDLSDPGAVRSLPLQVDYVYHLAALNGTQNFYERPFTVLKHCTLPTFHILEHYQKARLQRFAYAGSSESYASTVTRFNWAVPTDESVPLSIDDLNNPRWSYGASKLHGEVLTIQACREFGFPYTVIRYHNAYGPRMGNKHVIPDFLERIKASGKAELFGYEDTRSFIYAEDAVRATQLACEADGGKNQIVHVGGEDEITMHDLGKKMLELMGRDLVIECHPSPQGSVKRRCPSIKKLQSITGYAPEWPLAKGLQETIKFYLAA